MHTPQAVSRSRSPTVSFMDDPNLRSYYAHPHRSGNHELQRISSASLPDLDSVDNACRVGVHSSTSSGSTLSVSTMGERKICEKICAKTDERGSEWREQDEDKEEDEEDPFIKWASRGMWHHLLYCLCPIEISEWQDLSTPVKIIQIIQAPIFILFRLTIPVVYEDLEPPSNSSPEAAADVIEDEEVTVCSTPHLDGGPNGRMEGEAQLNPPKTANERSEETRSCVVDFEDLHGWCRLLNCFQCLITPMLWVLLITVGGMPLGLYKVGNSNLPVVVIVLLVSTGLTITIFVTSRWDRAPTPYHRPFFATLGFLTSIVWIYAIAHELVNSLEALGIVWEISEAILGITVMAFASSISGRSTFTMLFSHYPPPHSKSNATFKLRHWHVKW
ncbi:unnamed protein product [Hydatigera taeniaeformis]|uniref:Sodium/calcium exchanger membrane region domain-containing protein n=1 Tax=Hydatigena taeniaeformis TaxID=6205 RepID=A0A3P7G9U7_HYDTA|nr:unnamed protein product [Hydatigera taeniaeformis]